MIIAYPEKILGKKKTGKYFAHIEDTNFNIEGNSAKDAKKNLITELKKTLNWNYEPFDKFLTDGKVTFYLRKDFYPGYYIYFINGKSPCYFQAKNDKEAFLIMENHFKQYIQS